MGLEVGALDLLGGLLLVLLSPILLPWALQVVCLLIVAVACSSWQCYCLGRNIVKRKRVQRFSRKALSWFLNRSSPSKKSSNNGL